MITFKIISNIARNVALRTRLTKLLSAGFGKEQKSSMQAKGEQTILIADLLDQETNTDIDSDLPSDPQKLLSRTLLQRCSPLMQRILQGTSAKHLESLSTAAEEPQTVQQSSPSNHNLTQFRHMLAGPLPNQAALDKFCLKKKCPIVLDIKYDGERTLISFQRGEEPDMISRNGKSQKISYQVIKERIQKQLEATDIQSIKMDGEIVVVDETTMQPLPLGQLMKLKNIKNREVEDWELEMDGKLFIVYIFDVVEYNGENLMQKPLIERRGFIPKIDILKPVQYRVIHFPEERAKIFEFFKDAIERKYEGLIIKGQNDLYFTNQTRREWKKLKRGFVNTRDPNVSKLELDLIVMGANRGSGFKNQKFFTSYLMGTRHNGKIIPISNVGSGFNEELYAEISDLIEKNQLLADKIPEEYDLRGIKADVFYKPQLVFEVHAQEFTLSPIYNLGRGDYGGLSLRFPSFKRIRDDKGIDQATTGEEILELSKGYHLKIPK